MSEEFWLFAWMRWATEHGLWEMISTIVLVGGAIVGIKILFWPKRRIRNLNFFIRQLRDDTNYPLKICVEIRNYTGSTLLLSDAYFVTAGLRLDPNARGHSPSGEIEVKFPAPPPSNEQRELEYLLRHRESVSTWIPIDPAYSDSEVQAAIEQKVGTLHVKCIWILENKIQWLAQVLREKPASKTSWRASWWRVGSKIMRRRT